MKSPVASFSISLIITISVTFTIHILILFLNKLQLFENKIILAYVINFALALGIYLTLDFLKKKFKTQLGFLFMIGSMLKFLVFFVLFYPYYFADGIISKIEFSTFFVPYIISLVIETFGLIVLLKNL